MFFRPRQISEVIVSCGIKFFITLRSVLLSFLFSYLPIQLFNWKSDKYRICITAALDLAKFWCRIIILQVAVIVKNPVMTCTMKCGCLPISIVKLGCNVRRRSIILHEEYLSKICFSFLITCYSPNLDVIFTILDPSKSVVSLQNQVLILHWNHHLLQLRRGYSLRYLD